MVLLTRTSCVTFLIAPETSKDTYTSYPSLISRRMSDAIAFADFRSRSTIS